MKLDKYGFNSYGAFRVEKMKVMDRAPFAIFKKHECRNCNKRLHIDWISQIIFEGTSEAEGKNLLFGFRGAPVQYTFAIFACDYCGQKVSINDQFYFEYPNKLKRFTLKYGDYRLKDDFYSYLKSVAKKQSSDFTFESYGRRQNK